MLQLIDSPRFMTSSLSNLVNNLSEGIHRIKCKYGHDDKKRKACRIKHKYCNCFLEYKNFKNNLIESNVHVKTKIVNTNFMKSLKNNFLIHTDFITITIISLFNCWKKVFILMKI